MDPGWSTLAKVVLAVGIVCGGLLGVSLVIFLMQRRSHYHKV